MLNCDKRIVQMCFLFHLVFTPNPVHVTYLNCVLSHTDGLHRIQISYTDSPDDLKKNEEEFIDFSDDQDNLVCEITNCKVS